MAVDDTAPRALRQGPIALAELFDAALKDLVPKPAPSAPASTPAQSPTPTSGDAFLFSGNRHETVPRKLFLDRRLTPLERNAWQVFRLMLNDDGVTAFPTYEQLRPWLASMPCAGQASHETVARALTLMRLTRWLSLVRRRRDPKTGRILGNLYVLHDEPLTPFEAMQLDPDYLQLVSQALGHSAKAVQIVGLHTLKEIGEDPLLAGRTLPSRLQVMAERPDTRQLTIEDCADLSRRISAQLDALEEAGKDPIDQAYRLEVSSPGIDRPLTRPADFADWAGHEAKIALKEKRDGRQRFNGELVGIDGDTVTILDKEGVEHKLPFDAIDTAKLVLKYLQMHSSDFQRAQHAPGSPESAVQTAKP